MLRSVTAEVPEVPATTIATTSGMDSLLVKDEFILQYICVCMLFYIFILVGENVTSVSTSETAQTQTSDSAGKYHLSLLV